MVCQLWGTLANTGHGVQSLSTHELCRLLKTHCCFSSDRKILSQFPTVRGWSEIGIRRGLELRGSGGGSGKRPAGCCPWCWEERYFISLFCGTQTELRCGKNKKERERDGETEKLQWLRFFSSHEMRKIRIMMYNLNSSLRKPYPTSAQLSQQR